MPKFTVTMPFEGALTFSHVEADDEEDAVAKVAKLQNDQTFVPFTTTKTPSLGEGSEAEEDSPLEMCEDSANVDPEEEDGAEED